MAGFWRRKTGGDHRLEHVEGVMDWLIGIGIASIIVMMVFGLGAVELKDFGGFFLWALFASLASLLAGAGLGLLFGLPTVRRVEISHAASVQPAREPGVEGASPVAAPPQQTGDDVPLGYAESTNLEHVADWLTKILIGLTLTQYGLWEEKFARLSYDLGFRLLGSPPCGADCGKGIFPAGSTIAGGALIVFYALLGFLIAYLWMRGYFITEMEIAKRAAKEAAARKLRDQRREEDADAARAQIKLKDELERLKAQQIASEQARVAAEAGQAAAVEAQVEAERARVAAETARAAAEAEAEAERARAREQGTLQERVAVTFTPQEASEVTDKVSFTAEEAQVAVSEIREAIAAGTDADDPWRGQFGGSAIQGGLRLSATATQTAADPHYYDVLLKIEATDVVRGGTVVGSSARVFLHPTFGTEPRTVYFNTDGVAQLQLLAYGAFTVGVLVEDGTKLELNLATIEGVDPGFLSR